MTYYKVKPITQARRIEDLKIKCTLIGMNNGCQVVKVEVALF